jgi:replicative DNA helicase
MERRRSEVLDNPLPKSVDLERELLFALLVAGDAKNLEGLHRRDFTDELHGEVFQAMKDVAGKGAEWLEATPVLERIGVGKRRDIIVAWLEKYRDSHGVPANIEYYKMTLRELRKRRALIALSCELLKRVHDSERMVGETRIWLERQLKLVDLL